MVGGRAYVISCCNDSLHQIIDDPSGNSFVENPHAPQKDHALVITHYNRTVQQEEMLGLQVSRRKKPVECSGIILLSGLLGISGIFLCHCCPAYPISACLCVS